MPTEAELRTLFHYSPALEASIDAASIDAAAVIRRSKRRRLPRQLGAGSVLTLAVAGIGVASISGLQTLAPMSASETVADSPMGVSEGSPFVGTDSATEQASSCETDAVGNAVRQAGLEVAPAFPATASTGQPVSGQLTLTNTGAEPVNGIASSPLMSMSRDGIVLWRSDPSAAGAPVTLGPGETTTLEFSFDAVGCGLSGGHFSEPLAPGEYELSAVLTVLPDNGPAVLIGGPASVITLR